MSNLSYQCEKLSESLKLIAPPVDIKLSAWADKNMQLSPEASARRGQWITLPYQREPMDCLSPSHSCDRVILMFSSQTGKTQIALNWLGFISDVDPGPCLFVEVRIEDAKAISKDRVDPMFRDVPALHGKLRSSGSSKGENSMLHKVIPGGHITFAGANSPAGLAMRPIRYLLLDEVDRYEASVGRGERKEGDPVSLAIRRTDTFEWNRKILICSTPTVKGASRIEHEYALSDQRQFYVPCPFCKHEQVLIFDRLKWPQSKDGHHRTELAAYECEQCLKHIPHHMKAMMMENGRWIAHKPSSKVPGFHLNQLYSLLKSWEAVCNDFLSAKDSPTALQTFKNTVLAELWEERHEVKMDAHAIMSRVERYLTDPLPVGVAIITAGVDVQDNRLEIEITGWGYDEESWSLAHHEILGNPMALDVWRNLDEILLRPFETAEGIPLYIKACCIDTGGHCSDAVYRYTRERFNRRVYAIKGRDGKLPVWPKRPSRSAKDSSPLFIVGVDTAKDAFYNRLKIQNPGPRYCHYPEGRSLDYFEQLTSERVVVKYQNGYTKRVWTKKDGQANECLDTTVYGIAALESLKAGGLRINSQVAKLSEAAAQRRRTLEEAQAVGAPMPAFVKPDPPQRMVSRSNFMQT